MPLFHVKAFKKCFKREKKKQINFYFQRVNSTWGLLYEIWIGWGDFLELKKNIIWIWRVLIEEELFWLIELVFLGNLIINKYFSA